MKQAMLQGIRHLFKLDPAKEIEEGSLKRLLQSGTDGILIGGTDGITRENTERLIRRIRLLGEERLPLFQEITAMEAVIPGASLYLIPFVLNATDPYWLTGAHVEAIHRYGKYIPWERVFVEGYLILNPEAKAFCLTKSIMPHDDHEAIAYAELGGNLLKLPILYLEYSGKLGKPGLVEAIRNRTPSVHLIYGGGITSREEALMMSRFADTIVVGNILYEDIERALSTIPRD